MKTQAIIKSISSFLNRPFPESGNISSYARTLFIIAVFVTLFLGLIQPFDMDQIGDSIWTYSIIYGAITFISGLIYELILRYLLNIRKEGKSYTFVKWVFQVIGLLLFISFFNYLYLVYEFNMPIDGLLSMIWATFLVGVFPTVFIGTVSMLNSEKRHSQLAADLNDKNIKLESTVLDVSLFDIPTQNIWFIESLQNYVKVYFWTGESIDMKTERSTLKSCEKLILNTNLVRCHRSYIVNTTKIKKVSGNAQGLKLELVNCETIIPVSRTYIPRFKA